MTCGFPDHSEPLAPTSAGLAETPVLSSSPNPLLRWLLISLLALGVRFAAWGILDSLYRDTIGFVTCAVRLTPASFLRDEKQEPIHPLLFRLVHALAFPQAPSGEIADPVSWSWTAFLVGMIFTLTTLWLLYALGRRLHSPTAGLWSAFLFAILPYATRYAVQGLSELPYLTGVLLVCYLVLEARIQGLWRLLPAGILCLAVILIRKEGVILAPIVGLYLLAARKQVGGRRLAGLALFGTGFAAAGILFVGFGGQFLWLPGFIRNNLNWSQVFHNLHAANLPLLGFVWITHTYQPFLYAAVDWVKMSGFLPAGLVVLYAFRRSVPRLNPGVPLLALFMLLHPLLVIVYTFGAGAFVDRYVFPAAVLALPIAAGVGTSFIQSRTGRVSPHVLARTSAVILALIFIPETLSNAWHERRPEIRLVARWIDEHTPPDSLVFTTDDRIGFYSRRTWQFRYEDAYSFPLAGFRPGRTYYVTYYPARERRVFAERIAQMSGNQPINFDPAGVFTLGKNEVAVYRLFLRTAGPVTSAPVRK